MKMTYKWLPMIHQNLCTGCGLCVAACSSQCLEMIGEFPVLTYANFCGSEEYCVKVCQTRAICMEWLPAVGDQGIGKWSKAA